MEPVFHWMERKYWEGGCMGETSVRSVERAIDILYCIAEGEKGLAEICRKVNLEKGTVHRHLSALMNKGVAAQNPATGNYTLGQGFFQLVRSILNNHDTLVALAKESLERLNRLSNETIVLDVPKGLYRLCVAQTKSTQDIIYAAEVGSALPIYAGAVGKVILGCMSESEREQFVENLEITPLTNATILDKKQLLDDVRFAAANGYAITFGERVEGSACISVPIIADKQLIAVLSILGPSFRLNQPELLSYLPAMKSEARIIALGI